jgi:hypothetical protein
LRFCFSLLFGSFWPFFILYFFPTPPSFSPPPSAPTPPPSIRAQ